ncbi:MAG: DUF29 family protein [Chloroherpetonaceae bacterium]|nr:DUF29 domain-containing protein [Chloroherpetonaceae bacterium]MCS7210242.1 DUF29 domain-containing protein [Chloroherpetonaceae bacterium]MDW8020777.1 DUF29 family protein [Chloroherpetonaceae bacterium]MDW8465297.1 DUF29 family protein [Chloroherpetonaceae bacterium]
MKTDWKELVTTSHLETARAIQRELAAGNLDEAQEGLSELVDAMSRAERRAVRSQLIRLMKHIIKWKAQPEKRSVSWAVSIASARDEIATTQEYEPSITDDVIRAMWEKAFQQAKKEAELEMQKKCNLESLSWQEVFQDEYDLTDNG